MLIDHPDLVDNSKSMNENTDAADSDVVATYVGDTGDDVAETSNSNTENTITLNIGEGASDAVPDLLICQTRKIYGGGEGR